MRTASPKFDHLLAAHVKHLDSMVSCVAYNDPLMGVHLHIGRAGEGLTIVTCRELAQSYAIDIMQADHAPCPVSNDVLPHPCAGNTVWPLEHVRLPRQLDITAGREELDSALTVVSDGHVALAVNSDAEGENLPLPDGGGMPALLVQHLDAAVGPEALNHYHSLVPQEGHVVGPVQRQRVVALSVTDVPHQRWLVAVQVEGSLTRVPVGQA